METPAIAIIGLACRFPGAANEHQYWTNLRDGVESILRFTLEELEAGGADMPAAHDPRYVPARAILEGSADFDAAFFGYSAREAEILDPQHRIFLECAWEAMENAGYAGNETKLRIGVFAGAGTNTYLFRNLVNHEEARSRDSFQIFLGNDKDFIPTRVSYKLNLRGPSMAVNTACSTSLVAVHTACQSLLSFQCDMALAGAVSIASPEKEGYLYQQGGIHSRDGHCRAFDAKADGTVGGNGAGIVVVKRLEDALADGDTIRAIIRGTAINNDGSGKVGYTAPSVEGQSEVIAEAQELAGVDPDTITFIEAHGTGTALGDPIEIEALTRAFRRGTQRKQFCAIGSVKTNFGHLDAAAGMAGLIKAVLALEHQAIPPTLHFESPNPRIALSESPFFVNAILMPWKSAIPRRAGVSSFGIGGTNAHVVLEEAPFTLPTHEGSVSCVLPLSARTPEALARASQNLADHVDRHPALALRDVAYTLQTGRKSFAYRTAVVADSLGAASRALREISVPDEAVQDRPVALLFPGQGAQRGFMAADLYRTESLYQETIDDCASHLKEPLGVDLRELMCSDSSAIQRTDLAQCSLFVVEYALAIWLRSIGVEPQTMLGHSLGEYVAACLAGVFSLSDALNLIVTRGALMRDLPEGSMLAVPLAEDELRPCLSPGLAIAAVNGPTRTVISGPAPEIQKMQSQLEAQGFQAKLLRTSHAFHSAMMDPILSRFEEAVRRTERKQPQVRYISNVTGTWITPEQAVDPEYWVRHLRGTVRFNDGLTTLMADANLGFLEAGPGQDLSAMVKRHPACGPKRLVLPVLGEKGDLFSKLWSAGIPLNWSALNSRPPQSAGTRRRVPLPTYPFERKRYYLGPVARISSPAAVNPAGWLSAPSWVRQSLRGGQLAEGPWLIFADSCGLGAELAARLPEAIRVEAGEGFHELGVNHFRIDPRTPAGYLRLLSELPQIPKRIAHLWTVNCETGSNLSVGFYSVFHLLRALGEIGAADGIQLHLVSTGTQDVTGTERIQPETATMLAFVRVAPQEYPNLTCRSIDLEPETLDAIAEPLIAELGCASPPPVVAYRGRHRWVQTMEAVEPREEFDRKQGAYLITGGTGGLGLEFATHLARTVQANLALVSRSPWTSAGTSLLISTEEADSREQRIKADLAIPGLDSYKGLTERLNQLCTLQILAYLHDRGVNIAPGSKYTIDSLFRELSVIPLFEKFVLFFVRVLCEDDIVLRNGQQIEFRHTPSGDWREHSNELQRQFPGFAPTMALLGHCAEHFGWALSGEMESVRVLFPDGKSHLMMEAGRDTVEHLNGRVYRTLLKDLLAKAVSEAAGRRIRILEIGAGHGVLTGELLPAVEGADVEYTFTDLGKAFVRDAERRAAERGLDFMKFQVLDITAPPEAHGLKPGGFDLVVGLDVVHATANIAQTLMNLHRYLAPGGTLALVETLRVARWNEMIFGLTEGWWYFEDPEARLPGTPILDVPRWRSALEAAGYVDVDAFPRDGASDSGLLLARKPACARLLELQKLGSDVLVMQADVSDRDAMDTAVNAALARFGRLDGILHCAAVDDQGSIQWKEARFEEREFAAKIAGTQILDAIVERTKPGVFLLCSSLNTVTGGPGQIGYCAANSYLDAFAHARATRSCTRTVSVNWDRWQGIGLAADFEAWHFERTGQALTGGMTVDQGLAILDRVLWSETPPQVIVSMRPLIATQTTAAPVARSSKLLQLTPAATAKPGFEAPETPVEIAIAAVFEATLGGGPVGRNDNFTQLGGDSLIAIQVVSRIRESLQVELPLRSVFESPTVAQLAETVANRQWVAAAPDAGAIEMQEGVL